MKGIVKTILAVCIAVLALVCAGCEYAAPKVEAPSCEAWVLFINAQKGDAALIAVGGSYYVVDTGRKENADVLCAMLRQYGVEEIEGLFLTHSHKDHTGGLSALSKEFTIKAAYRANFAEANKSGQIKLDKKLDKLGLEGHVLYAGDTVELGGGAYIEVLAPLEMNEDDDNDNSLVFMLYVNGHSVLFTGDMQFAEENTLLEANVPLNADILKVGNHGNPDATGDAFATAVSPKAAIISTNTAHDTDSANERVISALKNADIYITQHDETGVLVRLEAEENGGIDIEYATKYNN